MKAFRKQRRMNTALALAMAIGMTVSTKAQEPQANKPHLTQGIVTISGQDSQDFGYRSTAVVDLGAFVATHLYEKLPGIEWEEGFGKIASIRKKGIVQPGVAVFKFPNQYVAAADITTPYKVGRVSGFGSAMLPFDSLSGKGDGGAPFFLLQAQYKKGPVQTKTFANINAKSGPAFFQQEVKYRLWEGKQSSLYGTAQVSVPRKGHTRGNVGLEYQWQRNRQ